ncbi:MAG: transposase [Phycisphaerae bacterium]|jgi:hypothetical protein
MPSSRYREARTLVRRLCRLPGEDRAAFKGKVARLREHFERFNVDVAELCQWLMGLRRRHADASRPGSFGVLGDFLLEPAIEGVESDEAQRDRWRLAVFDDVAGFRPADGLADRPISEALRQAMTQVAAEPPTPTARRLFERLARLEPAHRLVLLKAAAEWVVARYRRGVENWVRRHEEWEKEKSEWERRHPDLTDQVRDQYTAVFKTLKDPAREGLQGVRRKNPRICPYRRLEEKKDNCIYAGQKGHGPLCWKYDEFCKTLKERNPRFNERTFAEQAEQYLQGIANRPKHQILRELFQAARDQQRFSEQWQRYLRGLNLNESNLVERGRLPHCLKIGGTWEQSKCEWNPHTDLCNQYRRALVQFDPQVLRLEDQYREWRRRYLAGPRKPVFRYPSSRELPMPKIFGAGFHEIDLDRSVLRLRLDDMPAGEWLEFGITPWPRDYRPSRREVGITSVHVNFVGARVRVGLRFDVPHRASRFGCSQDEIDELRSRRFPRQAQDQEFLEAARKRLLESFSCHAKDSLRLLAVDLGLTGACAAVYQGRAHQMDVPLPIIKIDRLYAEPPQTRKKDETRDAPPPFDASSDPRGLTKEHVGRHLKRLAEKTADLAARRRTGPNQPVAPGDRDLGVLNRHVAWMIRDWIRLNAAQVMAVAEKHGCDLIVFESLRGFRLPGYHEMDPDKKRRQAMFAFGRVRRKVVEKAVERGMRVVTVPYFKSSQFCSACRREQRNKGQWRRNKREGKFKCEHCGCQLNSDANAAQVLARVFWGEIQLPRPDSES